MPSEQVPWRERAVSAEQAVAGIRPGARVFIGSACATPRVLLAALESDSERPHGIELVHFLTDGAGPAEGTVGFRHRAWYVGTDMRDLARAGRLDYVPMSLAAVPQVLSAGLLSFDVAFVQVAPPEYHLSGCKRDPAVIRVGVEERHDPMCLALERAALRRGERGEGP